MTLYDPDDEQHLRYLSFHRARWTRDKERALQARFANVGTRGEFGLRVVGTLELARLLHEAQDRGTLGTAAAISREIFRRQTLEQ